jgi:hypothetical protein
MVGSIFDYEVTNPTLQEDTQRYLIGAYNSITGYLQNVCNFGDEESKFKSIMYGQGLKQIHSAFNLCADFAKRGSRVLNFN